jgi:prepilin-type N-terminal cleavage/methylation domain-containing protein
MNARAGGFTLIELMIGITIMALLLLAAAPFTQAWVDGTRQMRARSNLLEAVGQARSLAMRNPQAIDLAASVQGVAAVVYDKDAHELCVVSRSADGSAWNICQAGDWRGRITQPADLSLLAGDEEDADEFVCAAYDSRGLLVASSYGGMPCITPASGASTEVSIRVGSQEVMHVALL